MGGGGGGGKGVKEEGLLDGQTNTPEPIRPFNFFEVGGITMHYCTSYVPDKLNF